MRKLPPLPSLRSFEAVARNKSFSKAAKELNVTQSAISHQIRVLEEHLGLLLFRRLHNGIELTTQAEHLLPVTRSSFDEIARAVSEIREKRPSLIVHCSTSFALLWLLRRIGEFERAYPDITVRLSSWSPLLEEQGQSYDIEVVYESDPPSKQNSAVCLLDEWMMPVCSPELLQSSRISPADIVRHRLLVNSPNRWDWKCWGKFADVDTAQMNDALDKGIVFDADSSAIETAIRGQGIALANLSYAKPELDSGVLVPAVQIEPFKLGAHYLLPCANPSISSKTFTRWITDRAEETVEEVKNAYTLI